MLVPPVARFRTELRRHGIVFVLVASLALVPLGYWATQRDQPDERPPAQALAMVASEPVPPDVREVPLTRNASTARTAPGGLPAGRSHASSTIVSEPQPVSGFGTVGVTWEADLPEQPADVQVLVRTEQDGRWSTWTDLEYDAEHGPDPGSVEGKPAKTGTDPFAIGDVDAVQTKVTVSGPTPPQSLSLAIVDPGTPAATKLAEPALAPSADDGDIAMTAETQPATPQPSIFSRAQWGADEKLRDRASLRYGRISVGFVHHTVNANDYTKDQVPALLRGIYAYHTQAQGWSDIGYNFVVDRFGRIWEGRYGGVAKPVVGAHTFGYNEYSFAMSALGNFETARPSADMLNAYADLYAWKLSLSGIDPTSRQRAGSETFAAISGHSDAGSTACPGRYLYDKLPAIRRRTDRIEPAVIDVERDPNLRGSRWPDVVLRNKTTQRAAILETGGQLSFARERKLSPDWRGKDLIVPTADLSGDRVPDVIVRRAGTGGSRLYLGSRSATFAKGPSLDDLFSRLDQLAAVGDLSGDGPHDLVGRTGRGNRLYLYPGTGDGGFARRVLLADDWARFDTTVGAGDLTGDGRPDLVARAGDTLHLARGGRRGLRAPVALPGRWGQFDVIAGGGDATNDGLPDLIAKQRRSQLSYIFRGDGQGLVPQPYGPFAQFEGSRLLAITRSMNRDRASDVIMQGRAGSLALFANNRRRNVVGTSPARLNLTGSSPVVNVGDWNSDGVGDLVLRETSTGRLLFRAGRDGSSFAAPVTMRARTPGLRGFVPVGDMSGDGAPDLLTTDTASGTLRLLRGDGSTGFKKGVTLGRSTPGSFYLGVGLWNGDGFPDVIEKTANNRLLLHPGKGFSTPWGAGTDVGSAKGIAWLRSIGDADGDGRPDLVARRKGSEDLWFLPGARTHIGTPRLLADNLSEYRAAG